MPVGRLTVHELQARLAAPEPPLVLDVRERWEYERCHLPDSLLIPMNEVPARLGEIPRTRDVVVLCHHGARSLQVAHFLDHQGYGRILNLAGGIDAWARSIDIAMSVY